MTSWNGERLQDQFKQVEHMAQAAQDDCKRQVHAGKRDYEAFYDEAAAKECIANRCKTTDGLDSRDRMLVRLRELREVAVERRLHFRSFYDADTFHEAALAYIDALIARFEDEAVALDIRSV